MPGRAFNSMRRASPRAIHALTAHPIAAVVVVALLARVILAVGSHWVTRGYVIPDERLYMELATNASRGIAPDSWYPNYGQSFDDSVRAFSGPLIFLFKVFGPHRVLGQMLAAVAGAAAAGVTVAIGLRFLRPAFAMLAGLVVALTPSQALFSSVVLREGEVWLALTLVGLGAVLMMSPDRRRLVVGAVLAAAGLFALGYLRDQTLLGAAWSLALAAILLTPRRNFVPRVAACLALALAVPWIAGLGPAGEDLVRGRGERLAQTRAVLAVGANSAFPGTQKAAPPPKNGKPVPPPSPATQAAVASATQEQSVRAGIGHLPAGLVDVTLRPFPWQATAGLTLTLARVETLAWYALYALTILGVLVSLRRREARLALRFPVLLLGMLLCIAALTQGNVGTSFRHREQTLWVMALCAGAALQWLVSRSRWAPRREEPVEPEAEPADPRGETDVLPVGAAREPSPATRS
jgi:hypothetical protein